MQKVSFFRSINASDRIEQLNLNLSLR